MMTRVNQIYIINQIIIYKIKKFNDFSIFNLFKLSDHFLSTFILSIIFLDFISKFQKYLYHNSVVNKNSSSISSCIDSQNSVIQLRNHDRTSETLFNQSNQCQIFILN